METLLIMHSALTPLVLLCSRRAVLSSAALVGGAAAVGGVLLPAPPAAAVIKGYEPMPALKDKDYGKSRMT